MAGDDDYYLPVSGRLVAQSSSERFRRQCLISAQLARVLKYVINVGLIDDPRLVPDPAVFEWERVQRNHILKYMRLGQNPELSETERIMGGRIDRVSLDVCNAVRALDESIKLARAREHRRKQEEIREAKRRARIMQRRIREVEQQLAARPARPKKKQKPQHEEVEQCSKCHKRPAVSAHLCKPCLKWEEAKFGRS